MSNCPECGKQHKNRATAYRCYSRVNQPTNPDLRPRLCKMLDYVWGLPSVVRIRSIDKEV